MSSHNTLSNRLADVNCVLWDLDGTLTDSIADICTSMNVVLEQSGLNVVTVEEARLMVGLGAGKLLERAFRHVGGEAAYDADTAYASFIAHYRDHCCINTRLYPGVETVVSKLNQYGYRQAVCTNKPVQMANTIVTELGLADYFGSVVGGDSTEHRKPHAEPILACVSQLQSTPDKAIMIGDSPADAGCAIAAGVPVVLVDWGYSADALDALGADLVISNIDELLTLLPAPVSYTHLTLPTNREV